MLSQSSDRKSQDDFLNSLPLSAENKAKFIQMVLEAEEAKKAPKVEEKKTEQCDSDASTIVSSSEQEDE
jgi:hypothetical protein